MRTFYDLDADLNLIKTGPIAIIGYGNQGRAHALNLRDSEARVLVAGRAGSASLARAAAEGFATISTPEAVRTAETLMLLAPDEHQPEIFAAEIAPHLRAGQRLLFAHGLCIHFGYIKPPPDIDVALIAPKGPGLALRAAYEKGGGLPALVAVHQDASGRAMHFAIAYAAGLGAGRAGILECTFAQECVVDLFGEQSVVCGGVSALCRAAYDTLVAAGYPPIMAYFDCIHELKLTVDLIYARGVAGMTHAISNTAEFGAYRTGARLISPEVRAEMARVLEEIESGAFAQAWMREARGGMPMMQARRAADQAAAMEQTGAAIRAMLPDLK